MRLNQTSFTFTIFFRKSFELIKSEKGFYEFKDARLCEGQRSLWVGCVCSYFVKDSSSLCWHYVAKIFGQTIAERFFSSSFMSKFFAKLNRKSPSGDATWKIEMSHYLHDRQQTAEESTDEKLIESQEWTARNAHSNPHSLPPKVLCTMEKDEKIHQIKIDETSTKEGD